MNSSLRLGSVFGITIRVHVLLLVLLGLLLLSSDGTSGVIYVTTLFTVVLLHELGHSLVAQSFGIHVLDITLWPLGGIARMSEMPESSRIEGLVAIAGPAVNFVLAALAAMALWIWAGGEAEGGGVETFALPFLGMNLVMGVFNLIPAFPTDGGRLLRAFLGRKGDWLGATVKAVRVGRFFALLMALAALPAFFFWSPVQSFIFVLIAGFLWMTGAQELMAVRSRHTRRPFDVFRNMARETADWSSRAAGRVAAEPVRVENETHPESRDEAHGLAGFSESEIDKLERFRGPLRNFRRDES